MKKKNVFLFLPTLAKLPLPFLLHFSLIWRWIWEFKIRVYHGPN